jgi:hypothetical protein
MSREITHARIPKTVTADNSAATVTITAPTNGASIFIVAIYAGFGTALTGAKDLTLTDGTTTLGNWDVFSTRDIETAVPFQVTPNCQAVISLPASGTGGNVGKVTVVYYIV